jgi:hypothetical protein
MEGKIVKSKKLLRIIFSYIYVLMAVVPLNAAGDVPAVPDKFQEEAKKREVKGTVSSKIQNLLGVWEGSWQGEVDLNSADFRHKTNLERKAKIVIYKVSKDEALLLYGYGPSNLSEKANWYKRKARITEEGERVKLGYNGPKSGDPFEYILEGGMLKGESKGIKIKMKKVGN